MAYVCPIQPNPDFVTITLQYRAPKTGAPVYVVCSANAWVPEQMTAAKDTPVDAHDAIFERTIFVPRGMQSIVYKFRVGDGEWGYDPNAPTENDGFCGMNNRFDVPLDLPPTPPPELLMQSVDSISAPGEPILPPPQENTTALPSPAATPRDTTVETTATETTDYEGDSGTEIEAPSVSDWEPTEEADLERTSDHEIYPSSPNPGPGIQNPYSMSENADWIVI